LQKFPCFFSPRYFVCVFQTLQMHYCSKHQSTCFQKAYKYNRCLLVCKVSQAMPLSGVLTDENQKQTHLDWRMDDEELPTSVCQKGSLYMQCLHSSVNCPDIHFAQTLWQCFSNGGIAYHWWYAKKFRKYFFEYLKFINTKCTTKTVLNELICRGKKDT